MKSSKMEFQLKKIVRKSNTTYPFDTVNMLKTKFVIQKANHIKNVLRKGVS